MRSKPNSLRETRGGSVVSKGEVHSGVWVIESGLIRTFYIGAQGRELTLAQWTPAIS